MIIPTKCIGLNFWHLVWCFQWTYYFILLNIVISACCAQDTGDIEVSELIKSLESDQPVPEQCGPFVNVTKINDDEGYFYSPGWPENYPSNIDCILVLEAPPEKTIKLDFRDYFEIEESEGPECQHDYLEIRDGPYGFSELINGRSICSLNKFPDEMLSRDRYLWIHFKSDSTIEYRGFKAVYQFVERKFKVPEIRPCVMSMSYQEEGEFGLHNISQDIKEYHNLTNKPIDCLCIITVREGWKVYLQFAKFNLDNPNECTHNFIQIFRNRSVQYIKKDRKFCGSKAEPMQSEDNKMYVRFFNMNLSAKVQFSVNFTAFRKVDKESEKKCDEETEFYCEDDTCISKSLKCNDKYNCRTRFDEEDDDCLDPPQASLSGEHIYIIMVIFSLILTGMCITFLYNCITKLIRDHRTIQEFIRASHEQQLNELGKMKEMEKKASSKPGSRSHSSPSIDSNRFDTFVAVNCHVPGGDVLPIPVRNDREQSIGPLNGDAYTTNIYTVDNESPPQMCDSACQTRESLFTSQEYSSGNSSPNHSVNTNSPPAPFSTFGYKKETKFKAEAKIEMAPSNKRRPYSVQTTKSAPDVIVTH